MVYSYMSGLPSWITTIYQIEVLLTAETSNILHISSCVYLYSIYGQNPHRNISHHKFRTSTHPFYHSLPLPSTK